MKFLSLAGINLPAGTVIIKSLKVGKEDLGVIQYRQMCGRAGRAGHSSSGESYLFINNNNKEMEKALSLANSLMPNVSSQMRPSNDGGKGLLKITLEVCYLKLCSSFNDIYEFILCSLMSLESLNHSEIENVTKDIQFIKSSLIKCFQFLLESKAIELVDNEEINMSNLFKESLSTFKNNNIVLTKYGNALIVSGLSPDEATIYYQDLLTAQSAFNLENNLLSCYLITSINNLLFPDFKRLWSMLEISLNKNDCFHRILKIFGINENLLFNWTYKPPSNTAIFNCTDKLKSLDINNDNSNNMPNNEIINEEEIALLAKVKRLWTALLLNSIMENDSNNVNLSKQFNISLNELKIIKKASINNASKMQRFCTQLGWTSMEKIVQYVKSQLNIKKTKELKELLKIPGINKKFAKLLIDIDIHSAEELISYSTDKLMEKIHLTFNYDLKLDRKKLNQHLNNTRNFIVQLLNNVKYFYYIKKINNISI